MSAAAEAVALPRVVSRTLTLPFLFVAATVYHFLQSRGHATPTVFNDELLYSKLSQSIAAGHGLSIRGEHFFFPAPLAPLVQSPAWLLSSMPDAYLAAVAVCERGRYRRHLLPAALTALLVAALVGIPGALGQYGEATHIGHDPGAVAHWALTTASLLPFSLGLAVVPGALFGFALLRRTPIGVISIACTVLFLGQAALIAAGEAHRPLERYVFYVTPLVFLAFFAYVERGVPWRRAYVLFPIGGAVGLALVSFPRLAGTAGVFFAPLSPLRCAPA